MLYLCNTSFILVLRAGESKWSWEMSLCPNSSNTVPCNNIIQYKSPVKVSAEYRVYSMRKQQKYCHWFSQECWIHPCLERWHRIPTTSVTTTFANGHHSNLIQICLHTSDKIISQSTLRFILTGVVSNWYCDITLCLAIKIDTHLRSIVGLVKWSPGYLFSCP